MKILNLKIEKVFGAIDKCTIKAVCEGSVDFDLPSKVIGKDYELIIREVRHKRTLTANAYYQVLLDKLSRVLRTSREELHIELLRRYGATQEMNGSPVIFAMRSDINPSLVCKYFDVIRADGEMTTYRALKGSSEMDSREFAHLLDGLISECNEVGIETMTPEEIARLKYEE